MARHKVSSEGMPFFKSRPSSCLKRASWSFL
jgi:hypothetical protein